MYVLTTRTLFTVCLQHLLVLASPVFVRIENLPFLLSPCFDELPIEISVILWESDGPLCGKTLNLLIDRSYRSVLWFSWWLLLELITET